MSTATLPSLNSRRKKAPEPFLAKVRQIKQAVANEFGVPVSRIDSRDKEVPLPMIRHVAMYLARKCTTEGQESLPLIARAFNRVNHVSVIHAIAATNDRRSIDPAFSARVSILERKLAITQPDANA